MEEKRAVLVEVVREGGGRLVEEQQMGVKR